MSEQFINKSTLKDNYSVVPNNMLNDEGLDADCLAVMVYLLSKPSNWIVKPTNLQNRFKFGRDKAYRIINQLIKKQYIVREEHRVEGKYTSLPTTFMSHHFLVYRIRLNRIRQISTLLSIERH